ncbi:hypothetical protein [Pseudomonas kuykendallii]|uniref:hypothetical protein n=1 Tax=Pseudomonas kuykendallii TaxID=1007099 RepID=UPI002897101D|nr:hypothetical protein [Pseudomonas kuykendallii]
MTISTQHWQVAFSTLQQFERQLIAPNLFSWNYIVEVCGISKPTLWRNKEFSSEFQRIKILTKNYVRGEQCFDQVTSLKAARDRERDQQIEKLKAQVEELTSLLNRERERVLYASMIARRKNIDPAEFLDGTPLFRLSTKAATVVRLPSKDD